MRWGGVVLIVGVRHLSGQSRDRTGNGVDKVSDLRLERLKDWCDDIIDETGDRVGQILLSGQR